MISFSFLFEKKYEHSKGADRSKIRIGSEVMIVEKKNQKNGKLTRGFVVRILTSKPYHSRGVKVLLDNGKIGRVQEILVY